MGGVFYIVYIVLIKTAVCFSTAVVRVPFNEEDTINCTESTVLQIVNISIEQTTAERVPGVVMDDVQLEIANRCNGQRSCMLSSVNSTYLNDCGYISVFYSCDRVTLNCNFERNLCQWSTGTMPNIWTRNKGSTHTPNTGPSSDHTYGSERGFYVYMDASKMQSGESAYLTSAHLEPGDWCLTFWYHMYGNDMGTLKVYLDYTIVHDLFNKSGNKGDKWYPARLKISIPYSKRIIFEGKPGHNFLSDIAIDDIMVVGAVNGSCSDIHVTESLPQIPETGQKIGTIVGIALGAGVMIALIVVLLCIMRRYRLKSASNEQQDSSFPRLSLLSTNKNVYTEPQNNNTTSDYDHLNIDDVSVHDNTSGHNPSLNNTADHNKYDFLDPDSHETGFDRKAVPIANMIKFQQDTSLAGQTISNYNQYAVVDQKNEDGIERHIKLTLPTKNDYYMLDPNETGFNRLTGNTNTKAEYELAGHIVPELKESDSQDQYAVTENETYDSSNNIRYKEADTHVYSYTVDNVYDTTSHDFNRRQMGGDDGTYIHFFGAKTMDDYDVTNREYIKKN